MLHGFTLMTLIFIGFLKLLNDAIPPSLQFPPGLTWWIFFKIQIQIFFILRTEKPPEILHFYWATTRFSCCCWSVVYTLSGKILEDHAVCSPLSSDFRHLTLNSPLGFAQRRGATRRDFPYPSPTTSPTHPPWIHISFFPFCSLWVKWPCSHPRLLFLSMHWVPSHPSA